MSKKSEFDNILDECLERLMSGETIEACLAAYPAYAAELEPLLRMAVDAWEAAAIKPRPEFRDRAGYEFQAAICEMEPVKARSFFGWLPRWAAVVAGVIVVVLLAGTGTVAASANSLPDEPLYQVKLATEAVRLTFITSALGKAELYAKFADERVEEIVRMAEKGKVEQVEKATERMNNQLIAMANLTAPKGGEAESAEIAAFEAAPAPMMAEEAPAPEPEPTPVSAPTPAPAPAPAPVIKIPQEPVEEAPALTAPRAAEPREEVGKAVDSNMEEKVKPDHQERLKIIVSEQALKNSQKLQELLERVPESLKPALRRALEIADSGYEQALRNLE